jgi:gliding motility-associated lipoprotein GldH
MAAALAFFSCSRNTIYSHYEPVDVNGWERGDTLYYHITTLRDSGNFSTQLGLRLTSTYPYQEVSLIMEQQLLPAGTMTMDTLNIKLADQEGNLNGIGLSMLDYTIPLSDILLSYSDTLNVSIRHNMRREMLPGITNIGITLEKQDH